MLGSIMIFKLVYGEAEDKLAADAKAAADAKTAAESATADFELPDTLKDKKTFSQGDVNFIVSQEKKKENAKTEKHIKELETLKKSQSLSAQDKKDLESRIEEMKNTLLTKEELAKKERERLESTHKQTLSQLQAERDSWQNRYTKSQINGSIVSEASQAEAFNPDDLKARE